VNTIWSDYVQSIRNLYDTRSLRFSDLFKKNYIEAFNIDNRQKLLEIGCGPGALSESLSRWYPDMKIVGIDRDSNFISFAKKTNMHINFFEGDATNLSFENESFDVTISNTVSEHIEPSKFYGEQYRVLKDNGVCLVLSSRRGINILADCVTEQSEFEKDIWKKAEKYLKEIEDKCAVCMYPQSEAEIPSNMQKYGFKKVSTGYATINLTPDNPIYSKNMAYAMINANRQVNLESVNKLQNIPKDIVTKEEIEELKRLVNKKYNRRLELYDNGIKQWDTNVSVIMIVRGVK
jgi:ubiquinone/menaquinone biosynthesis C-methylase UbiE